MPGIGPKSAQRILNWLLTSDDEVALGIAEAIVDVKKAIHLCPRCHNFAEGSSAPSAPIRAARARRFASSPSPA